MVDSTLIQHIKCDVFTPDHISQRMASFLGTSGTLLEPSCGTGNLLNYISLPSFERIDVYDIKQEYLNEIQDLENLSKHCCDFIKEDIRVKYDNIILNPPYIKIQDLSPDYRSFIKKHYSHHFAGSFDLYLVFLSKCLSLLKPGGKMVAITPNSYLISANSKKFRRFLIDNHLIQEVVDYGHEKVFPGVSTYTCITVFSHYNETMKYNGKTINYLSLESGGIDYKITEFVSDVVYLTLGDICKMKNGIATLSNSVFIHDKKLFDEPVWMPIRCSNTMKWVIYPYFAGSLITEDTLSRGSPLTYQYLLEKRGILELRDKGHKVYPAWYAYGRSQSVFIPDGDCLYIPTFIDPNNFDMYIHEATLFTSCISIEIKDRSFDLEFVKGQIRNNIKKIAAESSRKGGGWINLSVKTLQSIEIEGDGEE